MLPDVVFGCLHQGRHRRRCPPKARVVAVGSRRFLAAARWSTRSKREPTQMRLPVFSTVIFHCGGAGARPTQGTGSAPRPFHQACARYPWKQPRAWHRFCFIVASFGKAPAAPADLRGGLGQGHRAWRCRSRSDRAAVQFRACAQPGAGTRRRPARCIGRGGAAVRPSHPAKRAADRACARRDMSGTAGWRRLRRSICARSAARHRRRARRV